MKIWVDADGCPRAVKEIVLRASERLRLPVCLVADRTLTRPPSPLVSTVRVSKGLDEADHYIVEQAGPQDLVITADIPLAARVVAKGLTALNPRGELYTEENVREKLSYRDFMMGLREAGVEGLGGPAAFGPRDRQRFAAALDRLLTQRRIAK